MLMKAQHCSSSSLQQRIESLQRHIDILRSARKDAVLSARELRRANEKITAQLNSLSEKLCGSRQLTQVTWGKIRGEIQLEVFGSFMLFCLRLSSCGFSGICWERRVQQ